MDGDLKDLRNRPLKKVATNLSRQYSLDGWNTSHAYNFRTKLSWQNGSVHILQDNCPRVQFLASLGYKGLHIDGLESLLRCFDSFRPIEQSICLASRRFHVESSASSMKGSQVEGDVPVCSLARFWRTTASHERQNWLTWHGMLYKLASSAQQCKLKFS